MKIDLNELKEKYQQQENEADQYETIRQLKRQKSHYKKALEALNIAYVAIEEDYKKELMATQAERRRLDEYEIKVKRCQET